MFGFPVNDHLIVDVRDALDVSQGFLRHLLEEIAAHFAMQRDAASPGFEAQSALADARWWRSAPQPASNWSWLRPRKGA